MIFRLYQNYEEIGEKKYKIRWYFIDQFKFLYVFFCIIKMCVIVNIFIVLDELGDVIGEI